ncbi:30S ribosomal protein S23 [Deinococcus sp. RL]|uniref:four helix bundle protein n=1 Tax=Deinococcus sp. RL TaxID=1489678 RepID=UPI0004DA0D89|nr:four helix bundle protein [Deinococcus sp. RL]KEF34788.1 30S ribosomal protein S23 [Deinococcus sp. RL]
MRDYRQFVVWQKAHALTLRVYVLTHSFPADERFGLTAQLRRAAVSIPSNIAEGAGRASDTDFARFLDMAGGSANEVEYQMLLARDLGYVPELEYQTVTHQLSEVRRVLTGFRRRLKS